jgi:hypothetical protein
MPAYTDQQGLVISTRSAEAAALYVRGVRLLIERSPHAETVLRAAVAADPSFGLALAALACVSTTCREKESDLFAGLAPSLASGGAATRRERQHMEVIAVSLRGDARRALALARDHLCEFPDDVVIAELVGRDGRVDDGRRP